MTTDELHEYLLLLDRRYPVSKEMPVDFPYHAWMQAIKKLCLVIEKETCSECALDDQIQDAYFFAEVAIMPRSRWSSGSDSEITIRFSAFGSLAAVEIPKLLRVECNHIEERLTSLLTDHGFVPIGARWLQSTRYDGIQSYFREHGYAWWHRFFEYT